MNTIMVLYSYILIYVIIIIIFFLSMTAAGQCMEKHSLLILLNISF